MNGHRRGIPLGPQLTPAEAERRDIERRIAELEKEIPEIHKTTIRVAAAEERLRVLTNELEFHTRFE